MNKKPLSFILISLLLLAAQTPMALAHDAPFPPTYSASDLTIDTFYEPESLDPAWAYESAGAEAVMNAYETLIFFDKVYTDGPYAAGKTDQFVSKIASSLPTIEHFDPPLINPKSGMPIYSRFTFPIRTDVTFHHGAFDDTTPGLPPYRPAGPMGNSNWPSPLRMTSTGVLTPRDVEYLIERVMVQDRAGGPSWLLYKPLLGAYEARTPAADPNWGIKIDGTIEQVDLNSDGTMDGVQFNLGYTYPDMAFEQILCGTWASVVSEAWAVNEGDLYLAEVPGGWANWAYIYNKWHNPQSSLLDDAVDFNPIPFKDGGTGPYMIAYWVRGVAWGIMRFAAYRDGWPAPVPGSTARLGGYLETVTWYVVGWWPTRLGDMLSGTRDMVYVPRNCRDQVLGQMVGGERIRCYYPFSVLALDAFYFTMDIDPASTWVGTMQPPDTFSTAGIPPNIFGRHSMTGVDEGLYVRRGFAYAFNYLRYIETAYLEEGSQPADPVIDGLSYNRAINIEDETWEKHNELGLANDLYDLGESIYYDTDNSFTVSDPDRLIQGPVLPAGTPLVSFGITFDINSSFDEKHAENLAEDGWYNSGESIYMDNDHDGAVSVVDVKVSGPTQPIGTLLVSFVGKWKYVYNPSLAKYNLKLAWGGVDANSNGIIDPVTEPGDVEGALWTNGMHFGIVYDAFNSARQTAATTLVANVNSFNPTRFFLFSGDILWGPRFLPEMVGSLLPLFIAGWTADFTDPHDFVQPFMHSQGTFAKCQSYSNPAVDAEVEWAIDPSNPNPGDTYTKLQQTYYKETISVPIVQLQQTLRITHKVWSFGRHWEQPWCRGWYYNPLFGGSLTPGIESTAPAAPTLYAYHLWKAVTHFGDANNDGLVDSVDVSVLSAHWTGPPAGPGGYNPRADLSGGTGHAGIPGGTPPPGTVGFVRGIPDGFVDIWDKGIVNGYWGYPGASNGPSHP